MKPRLTAEQKTMVKASTSSLQKKEDLVLLMNQVSTMLYGENGKNAFDIKHLTYYANPSLSVNRYLSFEIKKKSGKLRTINAPVAGLKSILRCLNHIFEAVLETHSCAYGFVTGRSVADNASKHIGKQYVYNLDLQDFFHSFDRNRVKMGIWRSLFLMDKEKEQLAFFLASLCTHPLSFGDETRIVLPQGSPVSPVLTNMLCYRLDVRLHGLAKRFKVAYSRYADDITFSGNRNVFRSTEFQQELKRIIEDDQKLFINPGKTRLQKRGYRQEVTGVIVNEKSNVHRKYVKQLRSWIYYIEKYGMAKAEEIFRNDYFRDKGHIKNMANPMMNVITGKLHYLKMVKGENDSVYLGLKGRLEMVAGNTDDVNRLLDVWEKKGIEAVEDFFKSDRLSKYVDLREMFDPEEFIPVNKPPIIL